MFLLPADDVVSTDPFFSNNCISIREIKLSQVSIKCIFAFSFIKKELLYHQSPVMNTRNAH